MKGSAIASNLAESTGVSLDLWSYFTSNKGDRLIVSSDASSKHELEPERDTQALVQV